MRINTALLENPSFLHVPRLLRYTICIHTPVPNKPVGGPWVDFKGSTVVFKVWWKNAKVSLAVSRGIWKSIRLLIWVTCYFIGVHKKGFTQGSSRSNSGLSKEPVASYILIGNQSSHPLRSREDRCRILL